MQKGFIKPIIRIAGKISKLSKHQLTSLPMKIETEFLRGEEERKLEDRLCICGKSYGGMLSKVDFAPSQAIL